MTRLAAGSLAALVAARVFAAPAGEPPNFALDVALDPPRHGLTAGITVTLPAAFTGGPVEFLLSDTLEITAAQPAVERLAPDKTAGFQGINGSSSEVIESGHAARYRVALPAGSRTFTLHYRGTIDFPFRTPPEESARAFSETAGVIGEKGVYLAGSTLWYPYLGEGLFTFSLDAAVPAGWHLVSVGDGSSGDPGGRAHWQTSIPLDELHLVGGPLIRYTGNAGAAEAQVYLHEADETLARKYLEATARYIEMYRSLIGPYPYQKFALVENFWETGYGMPSFTLLGPEIIRFPFILTSSYPHEILHNWWGNSVFVDYDTGNWCEGLTAYMADHLMQEQLGRGAEYRIDTLKRYRDYVREGHDFPLKEFRSRHSAATEAVGYGKALMGFHMLRRQLGDDAFRRALASFYRTERGSRAGFADLRREFEKAGGPGDKDLSGFFEQWVGQPGAAELGLGTLKVGRNVTGYRLEGTIRQVQKGALKTLRVPVSVRTASGYANEIVKISARETPFTVQTAEAPLLLEVDPEFDVFRLLDARETATSVGQIMGEPAVLAVLPSRAAPEAQAAYRAMVESWASPVQTITVQRDDELQKLPDDRAVWVLGRENRFAETALRADAGMGLLVAGETVHLGDGEVPFADHSIVLTRRQDGDPAKALGFIAANPIAAAAGLGRKLPHYGKYSYLGFAGTEPANMLKGEWPPSDSPLRRNLRPGAPGRAAAPPPGRTKRAPLAELPAIYSTEALLGHVRFLADPAREGRGLGSQGLEAAAQYVTEQFKVAGLKPAGDAGGFRQEFTVASGPDGKPVQAANILGLLPGTDAKFAQQLVVVSAHYDHLGYGWPGGRAGEVGKIHPGADDNASGVAVLIELAKALVAASGSPRPILFAAFSGEEAGLLGSRYFVAHPEAFDLTGIRADVNFDTVGRLGAGEVKILAAASAQEWPFIFQGAGFSTGIKTQVIAGASESSDQQSFIDHGIPGVQIFSGATADYHRPTDTADKIDAAGMVKVALIAQEAVTYLAERPAPLTSTISGAAQTPTAATGPTSARRVSLGVVPDYAFAGPGVRADSVVEGSPAAGAGLQAGDVVLSIDGKPVTDLRGFSETLKTFSPGMKVDVRVQRGAEQLTRKVTLVER